MQLENFQFIVVQHGMAVVGKCLLFSDMCELLNQIFSSQLASNTEKIEINPWNQCLKACNHVLTYQYSFSLGHSGLLSYYKTCMCIVTYITHKLTHTWQIILPIFSKNDKVKHKTLTLHETSSTDITKH